MYVTVSKGNKKTGKMFTSTTQRDSCPSSCPLRRNGCYAENAPMVWHWDKVPVRGMPWSEFCSKVKNLAEKEVWRHNAAGDLPHKNGKINIKMLSELLAANKGKKGYTYTHHSMGTKHNRELIRVANKEGLTINLSANNLLEADKLKDLGIAPVVCLMPLKEDWKVQKTPKGNSIVRCPAEYTEITCIECKACALPSRKSIIGFTAHGTSKQKVNIIAKG